MKQQVTELGSLYAEHTGTIDPRNFPNEEFELYSIPAFDRGKPDTVLGVTVGSTKQIVQPGDVLLSRIVPHIRRAWVVRPDSGRTLIASGEWIVHRSKSIHPEYLRHVLISDWFHRQYMRTVSGVGGSLLRARPSVAAKIEVPVPPLSEQRRVAAILGQVDLLKLKQEVALNNASGFAQSLFFKIFGNPRANTKKLPIVPLAECCTNEDGKRIPVEASERANRRGGFPYYGASGVIDCIDDYIFEGERLLIGEDGANLLTRSTPIAFRAGGKFWVNNHAHVLAFNGKAHLRFLESLIQAVDLAPYISGTAQPKLNRSNLDRIPVPLPPLEAQGEFCNLVALQDKIAKKQRESLFRLNTLFSVLQHRAFRGEL